MRSILQQGSSVEKAIEKAWIKAGTPTEFSIQILEFGKKGFLGITKKQAIVSITYNQRRQTTVAKPQTRRQSAPKSTPSKPRYQKPIERKAPPKKIMPEKKVQQDKPPLAERNFWEEAYVNDIATWLKELIKIMGLPSSFKTLVNKKNLTISFETGVLEREGDERFLFSGLSYLLIQYLKKKYRKKFQGFRLLITSKRPPIKK